MNKYFSVQTRNLERSGLFNSLGQNLSNDKKKQTYLLQKRKILDMEKKKKKNVFTIDDNTKMGNIS